MKSFQLRQYTLDPAEADTWLPYWRDVMCARRIEFGFTIEFGYFTPERDRFIWMVSAELPFEEFRELDERWAVSDQRLSAVAASPVTIQKMELTYLVPPTA